MANGDAAAAAGMDVLDPNTALVKDGADEINKTRDYIAERTGSTTYADTAGHASTAGSASTASTATNASWAAGSHNPHNRTVNDGPPGTVLSVWVDAAGVFARNTSARKYKDDINDWTTDTELVKQLQAVTYRRKHTGDGLAPVELGLIADDVAEVFPELVIHHAGEIDGLRYDLLGVVLLPVIQQLITRVEILEQELDVLAEKRAE